MELADGGAEAALPDSDRAAEAALRPRDEALQDQEGHRGGRKQSQE